MPKIEGQPAASYTSYKNVSILATSQDLKNCEIGVFLGIGKKSALFAPLHPNVIWEEEDGCFVDDIIDLGF